jgi:hypothetical protein
MKFLFFYVGKKQNLGWNLCPPFGNHLRNYLFIGSLDLFLKTLFFINLKKIEKEILFYGRFRFLNLVNKKRWSK